MAESRRVVSGVAGIAAFLALTGAAFAGGSVKDFHSSDREFTYSFTITGTSDYVFRGISQTDNDPTIQGSFDIGYGIFYAGVWATGVDFGDDAEIEVDWYAGLKPVWHDYEFDFGVILYTYPGYADTKDIETLELKAGVSKTFDKLSLGAVLYYSPDYNEYDFGVYEFSAGYALPKFYVFDPSITGQYGYFDNYSGDDDYSYWNAGLSLAIDKITLDFRYWDTDISPLDCGDGTIPSNTCDSRFVFSVGITLP